MPRLNLGEHPEMMAELDRKTRANAGLIQEVMLEGPDESDQADDDEAPE